MKRIGSAPSSLRMAHGAANDRRDLGGRRARARDLPRREHDGPALAQAALGQRHHLDHALIGLARALAEGEDAVLVQDQALDVGLLLEHWRRRLWRGRSPARYRARCPCARHRPRAPAPRRRADRPCESTAAAWVWSTNLCGRKACSRVSTEGLGADESSKFSRCTLTMASSDSASSARSSLKRRKLHRRQAPRLDIGHVGARALDGRSPRAPGRDRRAPRVLTEVLPPPCSTSSGSRPSRRVV